MKKKAEVQAITPRRMGCLHCAPLPPAILPSEAAPKPAWGFWQIVQMRVLDGGTEENQNLTAKQLGEKYAAAGTETYLTLRAPLHEETYKWDAGRGRWVLVAQGLGFA